MALSDLLIDSDHPVDKVVGYNTGSVTIPAFDFNDVPVRHGLNFIPLPFMKWSFTSTFDSSYQETGNNSAYGVFISCTTNNTNTIIRTSNNTASPITIYYRVLYFAPYDIVAVAPETQNTLDAFNINTEWNYPKIFLENYIANTGGSVFHGLGYVPQVESWVVTSTEAYRMSYSGVVNSFFDQRVTVDENNLTYEVDPSVPTPPGRLYFRIYGDRV